MEYIKVLDSFENALPVAIRQHSTMGHLCGYVGVPEDHKWYKICYNQCLAGCEPKKDTILGKLNMWFCDHPSPEKIIKVHGGLTYSEMGTGKYLPSGFWWFGFDCAHLGDRILGLGRSSGGTYKEKGYVLAEIKKLAKQLAEVSYGVYVDE